MTEQEIDQDATNAKNAREKAQDLRRNSPKKTAEENYEEAIGTTEEVLIEKIEPILEEKPPAKVFKPVQVVVPEPEIINLPAPSPQPIS